MHLRLGTRSEEEEEEVSLEEEEGSEEEGWVEEEEWRISSPCSWDSKEVEEEGVDEVEEILSVVSF